MKKKKIIKTDIKHNPVENNSKKNYSLNIITSIFLFFLACLLYINTISHGFVLDDFSAIKQNFLVQKGTESISDIFQTSYRHGYWFTKDTLYRPLSLVMFAIEWQISPDNPMIHHIINILMYAFSGVLLFYTLKKLLSKYNIIIPIIASILFIAHPIHTEVVANIKSRDEILCLFFILISINLLLSYLKNNNILLLIFSLLSYFIAFLSKESAITFYLILPFIILFFTDTEKKKGIITTILFIIPVVLYLYIRANVLASVKGVDEVSILDNYLVGASDNIVHFFTAVYLLGKYLMLLILPHPLVSDYSFSQLEFANITNLKAIFSFIIYAALGFYALKKLFSFIKSKDDKNIILVFGIIFYILSISIASNLFDAVLIGTAFAERLMYFPSIGFCLILTWALISLFKINSNENENNLDVKEFIKKYSKVLSVIAVILVLYSFKTIDRNKAWKSSFSLYETDIEYSPNSARMRYFYGMQIMVDKAVEGYQKEIDSLIANSSVSRQYSDIINNLDKYKKDADKYQIDLDNRIVESKKNNNIQNTEKLKIEKEIHKEYVLSQIKKANEEIKLFISNNPEARKISELDALKIKTLYDAKEQLEIALKIHPEYSDAYERIGMVYYRLKDNEKALEYYAKSLQFDPTKARTYSNMGIIYFTDQNYAKAIEVYEKALEYDPRFADAYRNLGSSYGILGEYDKAVNCFNKGIEFERNNEIFYYYLGLTYRNKGDAKYNQGNISELISCYNKASEFLNKSIEKGHNKNEAYLIIGNIYLRLSEVDKANSNNHYNTALNCYKKVISIDPKNSTAYYMMYVLYRQKGEIKLADENFNIAYSLNPSLKK